MCGNGYHIDNIVSDREWGFAYGSQLVCSYHCMREMERRDRAGENVQGGDRHPPLQEQKKRATARRKRVAEAREKGLTLQEIADMERVTVTTISNDIRALKTG